MDVSWRGHVIYVLNQYIYYNDMKSINSYEMHDETFL